MMRCLVACVLIAAAVHAAENPKGLPKSFEQSYVEMQRKLIALKEKGDKVSADTEKELNDLLVQMNHEHAMLRQELDKKGALAQQRLQESKQFSKDWAGRLKRAFTELGIGLDRTWQALSTSSGPAEREDDL